MPEEPQDDFAAEGRILYTPHECKKLSAEILPIATIWECGKCHDHWEVQDHVGHHHWVRIRRAKYEAGSR